MLEGLRQADGPGRHAIVDQLASEGDHALPTIMQAFKDAVGEPDVRLRLARAVLRMDVTEKATAALEQMRDSASDPDLRGRLEGYVQTQAAKRRSRSLPH